MAPGDRRRSHLDIDPLVPATWPAECPKCHVALTKTRQCMGHSKRAPHKHCGDAAAPGQIVCRRHGGATPLGKAAGKRRLDRAQLDVDLGVLLADLEMQAAERPVVDVLLDAVHRCAAMVEVLGALTGGLRVSGPLESDDPDDLGRVWGPDHLGDGRSHIVLEMYAKWLKLAAEASAMAVRAGVEERKVQLVEQQAQLLASVIRGVVEDLGHDMQDEAVRVAVTSRLQLVRGEAA